VRRCPSFGLHRVQVVFPSGDHLVVPDWMLDEHLCLGMEIVERPVLSIVSLLTIRDLLDTRRPSAAKPVVLEASSLGGVSREPTPPESSSLGDPTPAGPSPSHATALSRVIEPDIPGGCS
jgi:hypothetical protein